MPTFTLSKSFPRFAKERAGGHALGNKPINSMFKFVIGCNNTHRSVHITGEGALKKTVLPVITSLALVFSVANNPVSADAVLRLATTTSTENSGLLDVLLPVFEKRHALSVHTIAVGTGKALRLGERGDVDVLMVHAKPAEEKFVADGFGLKREEIMFNYFLIVGPATDPANIKNTPSAPQALQNIHTTGALFLSRGDDSGTHKRELAIWNMSGVSPTGTWYREAGQGMGKVLQIAGELGAYTLVDRGTWLKLRRQTHLVELFLSDPPLYNPYSVIGVNPQRHPHVNAEGAQMLIDWLKSAEGQVLINDYRIEGEPGFIPLHLNR